MSQLSRDEHADPQVKSPCPERSERLWTWQAAEQDGPTLILTDAQPLSAFARFCDVAGHVWNLVEQEGTDAARLTVREAGLCPSGRLVAWDRQTKTPIEPALEPSIGIVEDPEQGVAGPIWVRGRIPVVAADGETYEVRNRVTVSVWCLRQQAVLRRQSCLYLLHRLNSGREPSLGPRAGSCHPRFGTPGPGPHTIRPRQRAGAVPLADC